MAATPSLPDCLWETMETLRSYCVYYNGSFSGLIFNEPWTLEYYLETKGLLWISIPEILLTLQLWVQRTSKACLQLVRMIVWIFHVHFLWAQLSPSQVLSWHGFWGFALSDSILFQFHQDQPRFQVSRIKPKASCQQLAGHWSTRNQS